MFDKIAPAYDKLNHKMCIRDSRSRLKLGKGSKAKVLICKSKIIAKQMLNIVIFGAPGSGKGTQSAVSYTHLPTSHLSIDTD